MSSKVISPHVIGQLINISGRQRMLSQRISFFATKAIQEVNSKETENFLKYLKNYEQSLNLFTESNLRLTDQEPGLYSENLYSVFHKTDNNYNRICEFINNCEKLLVILKDRYTPNDQLLKDIFTESEGPLLKSLNDIVTVYEDEAQRISEIINAEREEKNARLEKMVLRLQKQEEILAIQNSELEDLNLNLEKKVLNRTHALNEEKQKIKNIFDSVDQGILTIKEDRKIDSQISKKITDIFQIEISNIQETDFFTFLNTHTELNDEKIDFIKSCITTSINEESWVWDLNKDTLPRESTLKTIPEKFISFDWTPACSKDGIIKNIILSIRDITVEKQLEKDKKQQNEKIEVLKNIVNAGQSKISSFINRSLITIESFEDDIINTFKDDTAKKLHSVKGEARILGLSTISELTHDCETHLCHINENENTSRVSFTNGIKNIIKILNIYEEVLVEYFAETKSNKSLSLTDVLSIHINNFYNQMNKFDLKVNTVIIEDNFADWNEECLNILNEVFLHLINNSCDHGFLYPMQQGKTVSDIRLNFKTFQKGESVILQFSDSGSGIDLKNLSSKLNRQIECIEAYNLIFEECISTAESITITSGRGVGLSQVKDLIKSHHGNIEAFKNEMGGLTFEITLPLNFAIKKFELKNVA